jgi:hypothetical protein
VESGKKKKKSIILVLKLLSLDVNLMEKVKKNKIFSPLLSAWVSVKFIYKYKRDDKGWVNKNYQLSNDIQGGGVM